MVRVSLVTLSALMIGTGELSLGLTHGFTLESTNPQAELGSLFGSMTRMILGMSLGNTLGSLLDSIWHINWCGPWIGAWKLL